MTASSNLPRLALYHFPSCFFCQRVARVLEELELDVELHDVLRDGQARAELLDARGRATVPVLRIEQDGGVRWMPESADIIDHLRSLKLSHNPDIPGRGRS